jgi:hypothetical protein
MHSNLDGCFRWTGKIRALDHSSLLLSFRELRVIGYEPEIHGD